MNEGFDVRNTGRLVDRHGERRPRPASEIEIAHFLRAASQHRDASTASRQEHLASRAGPVIERQRFAVCVEFGREVEIVYPGADRGRHQRFGRVHERAGGVEKNRNVLKAGRDGIGIAERKESDTGAETAG
jgi:hypothetical protein